MTRLAKQIIIAIIFFLILAGFGFLVYWNILPNPSCFDNIQNQNEEGIDCGGPCQSCEAAALKNLEIIWGDVEVKDGTKLADNSVDFVLVSNLIFQTEDKKGLIEEVSRILKPKGMIAVIEWKGSFGGLGPKESEVVREGEVQKLFSDSLFAEYNKFNAGDYHYGIIFVKIK